MNWFKTRIINWLASAQVNKRCEPVPMIKGAELASNCAYNIAVFNAIGGKVVEFRRYDRSTDRSDHQVYVISDQADFGERLSKIITMESLK